MQAVLKKGSAFQEAFQDGVKFREPHLWEEWNRFLLPSFPGEHARVSPFLKGIPAALFQDQWLLTSSAVTLQMRVFCNSGNPNWTLQSHDEQGALSRLEGGRTLSLSGGMPQNPVGSEQYPPTPIHKWCLGSACLCAPCLLWGPEENQGNTDPVVQMKKQTKEGGLQSFS